MKPPSTIPRPWSERQREVLAALTRQAADRATQETKVQTEFAQRTKAIDKDTTDAQLRIEEEFRHKHEHLEKAWQELHQSWTAEYQQQVTATADEYTRRKDEAKTQYFTDKHALEQEFKESRWTTQTLFEADKKVAKDAMVQSMRQGRGQVERMISERKEAFMLLRGWRVLDEPPDPFPAKVSAGGDPFKGLRACSDTCHHRLERLRGMRLPRYIRGLWPMLVLVFLWAVVSSPGYFINEWYIWVGATTLILVPIGIWLRTRLIDWVDTRVLGIFEGMHQAVADGRAWYVQCVKQAKLDYRAQKKQLKKKTQHILNELGAGTRARLKAFREQRLATVKEATGWFEPLLKKLRREHERRVRGGTNNHQEKVGELEAWRDDGLKQVAERQRRQREETNRRHAEDWTSLATLWKQTCDRFERVMQEVDRESRRWFGTWSPGLDAAARGLPSGLRFGQLDIKPERIPQAIAEDSHLAKLDCTKFEAPALLGFPERSSLLVEVTEQSRAQGLAALEAILLRAWSALPPGKLRCTIIDPVGRGEHFAAFMHLADFEPSLVNSRIWTEAAHIEQRLADLTGQMETILQKFLRNQFQSLAEYNAQAGEVAEPFRILVVAHFPTNFSPEAARRLISLATSGARCGIYTLILADRRQVLPQSVTWEELEAACTVLAWQGDKFVWNDEEFARFPLQLDHMPGDAEATSIIHQVGEQAVRAMKVEVPFSSIAPAPAQWWTEDSRAGISVPLGRAGANRLQNLVLGHGTSQHVLIAGKTGSGKSTLLHVLTMQLAMRYSPDEVELYLIDFKKGVEFKTYGTHDLPHAKVVAIESEREFGLSVLQRLDAELTRRGELFRRTGVTDLASYRNQTDGNGRTASLSPLRGEGRGEGHTANSLSPLRGEGRGEGPTANSLAPLRGEGGGEGHSMPRILLLVDEFQEFFIEDDKLAQEAGLLFDRLVRQGRAFGLHVLLGSQTLGGAYSLARTTIDQMAVRIALQCSEADAHLILSRENTEARLLSRPGEAIYNAANGMIEGNNFFQVVWLDDGRRDELLDQIHALAARTERRRVEPLIVFEGNVAADLRANTHLTGPVETETLSRTSWSAWLGDAVAIKEPTRAIFRRQSGSNLVVIGQQDESALALFTAAALSLAQGRAEAEPMPLVIAHAAEAAGEETLEALPSAAPVRVLLQRELPALLAEWHEELERRIQGESRATPQFLFVYGLHRLRDVRRPDDDFGFSRKGDEVSPYKQFTRLLREGPPVGLFTIAWCDTVTNLQRYFERQTLREFEMRVLFQMSANDSSALMDSPAASRLGPQRAIFYTEDQGKIEKFRPYALPSAAWLRSLRQRETQTAPA